MKKLSRKIFTVAFLSLFATIGMAQDTGFRLGFKLMPAIATNGVKSDDKNFQVNTNGSALRMGFGPIADIVLTERYAITTGILFAGKRVGHKTTVLGATLEEAYSLQYIQIPIGLKLYTGELIPQGKGYIQFGLQPEIKVGDKRISTNATGSDNFVDKWNPIDISAFFGLGMEFDFGNLTGFAGLGFQKGFINTVNSNITGTNFLSMKTNLVTLEVGVKL
jgi:hypothetical protein